MGRAPAAKTYTMRRMRVSEGEADSQHRQGAHPASESLRALPRSLAVAAHRVGASPGRRRRADFFVLGALAGEVSTGATARRSEPEAGPEAPLSAYRAGTRAAKSASFARNSGGARTSEPSPRPPARAGAGEAWGEVVTQITSTTAVWPGAVASRASAVTSGASRASARAR